MTIRMSDIAELAGVSIATASRAFSHPEKVQADTLERILTIAKRYNYTPNTIARAIANRHTSLVGFLLIHKSRPFFDHVFFGAALDGFLERAKARGYHVVLSCTTKRNDNFEEDFIKDSLAGAVLGTREPDTLIKEFRKRDIPVVLINNEAESENVSSAVDDNYRGMRKIMKHLIADRGYTDIAFFSDRISHYCNMQRYFAYIDSLTEAGLKPYNNPDFPRYDLFDNYKPNKKVMSRYGVERITRFGTPVIFSGTDPENARKTLQKMLPLSKLPHAIVCSDDDIAIGVIKALQQAGLRVPQDVAVTGYDGIKMSEYPTPGLTTIHVDPYIIGATAMDLLQKSIEDPNQQAETIFIPNELVIRESS